MGPTLLLGKWKSTGLQISSTLIRAAEHISHSLHVDINWRESILTAEKMYGLYRLMHSLVLQYCDLIASQSMASRWSEAA